MELLWKVCLLSTPLLAGCVQKHFSTRYLISSNSSARETADTKLIAKFAEHLRDFDVECDFGSDPAAAKCLEMTGKNVYPTFYLKEIEENLRVTVSSLRVVFFATKNTNGHDNGENLVEEFIANRGLVLISKEQMRADE